jgi:hypothetical protein
MLGKFSKKTDFNRATTPISQEDDDGEPLYFIGYIYIIMLVVNDEYLL